MFIKFKFVLNMKSKTLYFSYKILVYNKLLNNK